MSRLHRIARLVTAALSDEVVKKLRARYGPSPLHPEHQYFVKRVRNIEALVERLGAAHPDTVVEWILALNYKHEIRGVEDVPRCVNAANFFFANSGTQRFRTIALDAGFVPAAVRNLFSYDLRTLESFEEEIKTTPASQAERDRLNKFGTLPAGAELIYNRDGIQIVKVTEAVAACELAKGSKWCTSDPKTAKVYLRFGPLYVIYEQGKKTMQMHVSEDEFQLMDLKDTPVEPDFKLITAFHSLGLLPNILYLIMLDSEMDGEGENNFNSIFNLMTSEEQKKFKEKAAWQNPLEFALVTGKPFPEGEERIAQFPSESYSYARYVLHNRFRLGEPKIIEDFIVFSSSVLKSYMGFLRSIGQYDSFVSDFEAELKPYYKRMM